MTEDFDDVDHFATECLGYKKGDDFSDEDVKTIKGAEIICRECTTRCSICDASHGLVANRILTGRLLEVSDICDDMRKYVEEHKLL